MVAFCSQTFQELSQNNVPIDIFCHDKDSSTFRNAKEIYPELEEALDINHTLKGYKGQILEAAKESFVVRLNFGWYIMLLSMFMQQEQVLFKN